MQDALLLDAARALENQGRLEEARKAYRQILARMPRHLGAQRQLALLAYREGRIAEALKENERALRINASVAGLHNNHGVFLMGLGRYRDAAVSFAQAVRLDPADAQARNNLGGALYKGDRLEEALSHVDAALHMAPRYAKAHFDRGSILIALGRVEEAAASCERAIALDPSAWEAHENRGLALLQIGRAEDALASFDAAVAANSGLAGLHVNRATVLEQLGRDLDAAKGYEAALALDPDARLARGGLLHSRMRACDWVGFDATAAATLAAVDKGMLAGTPFQILALPASRAQQRRVGALYADYAAGQKSRLLPSRAAGGKIRIAYVSPDMCNHAVAHALAPVLEAHDKTRFEVWGVSIAHRPADEMQDRLRAAMDGYVEAGSMSDVAASDRIAGLGVDIAVDLGGYTMKARPGIFARRAAPVQIAWLGYPGTTGSNAIDYLIADSVVVPEPHEPDYSEKIIRLPGSLFPASAGREISNKPMRRADVGLPEDGAVLCCFNNAYKITPDVFDVWMRLLRTDDKSVLWLSIRSAEAQENLSSEARSRGIEPSRLIFAPSLPLDEHLARHRLADLFLDTFYYGAHSTAVDALASGLPVLTRLGDAYAGRVAASLLTTLGLNELVTADTSSYEKKALELLQSPESLVKLKSRLAAAVPAAFDVGRFTRGLEAAYESVLIKP